MTNNINCILLCAGTGSRMNCDTKNKVCFDIMGKPAVVRVIENLRECGVKKFIVVVGNKAESVMNATSHIDGVTYAYQKEQSGTGNATLCGLKVLNEYGIEGPVLVVMGDKLIDKSVFKALIDDFYTKNSDISLITQPAAFNPSGGKIVVKDKNIIGIIENSDLLLLKIREGLSEGKSLNDMYAELELTEKQISKLSVKLSSMENLTENCYTEINGTRLSSSDITASGVVNCATYLYKRDAINKSILQLKSDNAQGEFYFTDTVMNIAQTGLVSAVNISDRKLIHTFNTVAELDLINKFFSEVGLYE